MPDMYFLLTGIVIIFDHRRRRLKIVANAFIEADGAEPAYDAAARQIQTILDQLDRPISFPPIFTEDEPPRGKAESNTTREDYHQMVDRAEEYIRAGDIFQMVPAQRFETTFTGDALELYRTLRFINPSPYMFCLRFPEGFSLVGSSPEVHVRLTGDLVEIRPIAGTRKRGATERGG